MGAVTLAGGGRYWGALLGPNPPPPYLPVTPVTRLIKITVPYSSYGGSFIEFREVRLAWDGYWGRVLPLHLRLVDTFTHTPFGLQTTGSGGASMG